MVKCGRAQGASEPSSRSVAGSRYGKMGTLISFSKAERAGSFSAVCPLSGISTRKSIVLGVSEFVPFPCHCSLLSFCLVFPVRPTFLLAHSLYGLEC